MNGIWHRTMFIIYQIVTPPSSIQVKHTLFLCRRQLPLLSLLRPLLLPFRQTKLQMTNLHRHPHPHVPMHPHLAHPTSIRPVTHNGNPQRRQLPTNLMRTLRHQLHINLHHVLHPPLLRGMLDIRPPKTMRQRKVIGVAILGTDAGGPEVIGLADAGDLQETLCPFVVARLGFVTDELFGCGRFDIDVVFDGAVDHFFDAVNVVGVFDADEAAVGFGESGVVVGESIAIFGTILGRMVVASSVSRFKLLRRVGTEFLLGRCQNQSVHLGFDTDW
mmetsp:Transcript_42143/g.76033  ORF Transcript_42143/g.76033 Transcript_42143/m.76033 type:complete len:274 (+) Transcript_42143:289-1110(+)